MKRAASLLFLSLFGLSHAESSALEALSLRHGRTGKVGVQETFAVATNSAEYAALWEKPFYPEAVPDRPPINFSTNVVVGMVLATASDGCTSVTFAGAQVVEQKLVVQYKLFKHRANEVCTTSFSTAFHFVSIPRVSLPIVFQEQAHE